MFYQRFWTVFGPDVITLVKSFLHRGIIPTSLGQTRILLIPRIPNTTTPNHFQPINLCNFIYKNILKVIVNGLKYHLFDIITLFHNAFIGGNQIKDNIVLTHEAFHYLRLKQNSTQKDYVVKLSMQNAAVMPRMRCTMGKLGICVCCDS